MKKWILLACLGLLTTGFAHKLIDPSRLIVEIKPGMDFPQEISTTQVKHFFKNKYIVYSNDVFATKKALEQTTEVAFVDFNYSAEKSQLVNEGVIIESNTLNSRNSYFNDPSVSRIWSFNDKSQNGITVNGAYDAYGQKQKDEVIVAVVDTGVDYNHEDLKANMWINENEIPGNGIDDDENGYIDDIHGIDTLTRVAGEATGDPMDTHNHGTHVAGTIGAVQNNNVGIAGIASNVKIMALRTVPNSGDETDIDVAESFLYAARNGARLINCSFGKRNNEGGMLVSETIQFIGENYGVLVITSAGNSSQNIDTKLTYPASFENEHMLVIASSTSRGGFSYFSNYGKKNVDVAAPGSNIYSTVRNNKYRSYSGTSMASPTTTGLAAELLSINPSLGPVELKRIIMDSVTSKSSMSNSMVTDGVVDLKTAIEAL